jgi:hypothetical protein
MRSVKIQEPTPEYVSRRLPTSAEQDEYFEADLALRKVFEQWPQNRDRGEVLAKVTLLNQLYGTRIMNVYPVAHKILKMDIDKRLGAGDLTLVPDIADTRDGQKKRFRLSFAAKYCAWHQPDKFQIFDSNVAWMLCEYRRTFTFTEVKWEKLRDYQYFMRVIDALRDRFKLHAFSRKQIDKFLWMEADRIWKKKQAEKVRQLD